MKTSSEEKKRAVLRALARKDYSGDMGAVPSFKKWCWQDRHLTWRHHVIGTHVYFHAAAAAFVKWQATPLWDFIGKFSWGCLYHSYTISANGHMEVLWHNRTKEKYPIAVFRFLARAFSLVGFTGSALESEVWGYERALKKGQEHAILSRAPGRLKHLFPLAYAAKHDDEGR